MRMVGIGGKLLALHFQFSLASETLVHWPAVLSTNRSDCFVFCTEYFCVISFIGILPSVSILCLF
jgi:hypothetical protein